MTGTVYRWHARSAAAAPAPMQLHYLVFDFSDEDSGRGSFDAMACSTAVAPARAAGRDRSRARLGPSRVRARGGALEDEGEWAYDLQGVAEPDTPVDLAYQGGGRVVLASRRRRGGDHADLHARRFARLLPRAPQVVRPRRLTRVSSRSAASVQNGQGPCRIPPARPFRAGMEPHASEVLAPCSPSPPPCSQCRASASSGRRGREGRRRRVPTRVVPGAGHRPRGAEGRRRQGGRLPLPPIPSCCPNGARPPCGWASRCTSGLDLQGDTIKALRAVKQPSDASDAISPAAVAGMRPRTTACWWSRTGSIACSSWSSAWSRPDADRVAKMHRAAPSAPARARTSSGRSRYIRSSRIARIRVLPAGSPATCNYRRRRS